MKVNIPEMYRFSKTIQYIFDENKSVLIAYDNTFDDPFETNVWQLQINAVENIVDSFNLRTVNKEETKLRNAQMHLILPILNELEYKILMCINAQTITLSLKSFGLAAFRKSITSHKIDDFHEKYLWTIAKINSNHIALADKGFDAAKVASITTHHNIAYNIQVTKDVLKADTSTMSKENLAIIKTCFDTDMKVLALMRSYAKSHGNTNLYKKATVPAILSSIRPTPPKKPKIRLLEPGKEIVLRTDLNKKNILQLELLSDLIVIIGRKSLKTSQLTVGKELEYQTLMELKLNDLPGKGKYVKLRNLNLNKKAKVRVFEVKIVGS